MSPQSERRTAFEFLSDKAQGFVGSVVLWGAYGIHRLRETSRREVNLALYNPEERHNDAMSLFRAASRLVEDPEQDPHGSALYGAQPPTIANPGRISVLKTGPEISSTTVMLFPRVRPPAVEKGRPTPKMPAKVFQTNTTLRFGHAEDARSIDWEPYYRTIVEDLTVVFPTHSASSWEDLAEQIDNNWIEGDVAPGDGIMPHIMRHEEALDYLKCIEQSLPI